MFSNVIIVYRIEKKRNEFHKDIKKKSLTQNDNYNF